MNTETNPAAAAADTDGDGAVDFNVTPDEGLSAPFNSWFTFFGQFFDHGLDLVNKGGNGTVFIPCSLTIRSMSRVHPPTSWCYRGPPLRLTR